MRRLSNWLRIISIKKDIFHVHTTSKHWIWVFLFYVFSKVKKSKLIISYHSLRFNYYDFNIFSRQVLKIIFKDVSCFIVTNLEIKKKLIILGADGNKISIIPAFIPPNNFENSIIILPNQINNFIKNHKPIISAYAYSLKTPLLNLHINETNDLYGIGTLIDLCVILRRKYPSIGFILCVTHLNDEVILSNIKLKILNNNILDNFLIYTKPINGIYNLWKQSDIFVRPTLSDGDSVALREALLLNIPSVASDSVLRPKGTEIFKNKNVDDLADKVLNILANYSFYKSKVKNISIINNFEKIMHIYSKSTTI